MVVFRGVHLQGVVVYTICDALVGQKEYTSCIRTLKDWNGYDCDYDWYVQFWRPLMLLLMMLRRIW